MQVLPTWSRRKDFIKLRGYLKIYETMKNTSSFPIKRKPPTTKKDPRSCGRARGSSTRQILFCFICLLKGAWEFAQPCRSRSLGHSRNPGSLLLAALLLLLLQSDFVISTQPSCPCSCGALKLKGNLLINTHHNSCLAWKFLGEWSYNFNSGWPQAVFTTFYSSTDILKKK